MGSCLSKKDIYVKLPPREMRPLRSRPDLLYQPMRNIGVMSSHNSYLQNLQVGISTSTEALKYALSQGCRCLELDIFHDEWNPEYVYVAHGIVKDHRNILITNYVPLQDCVQAIAETAFVETDDPLFLALQLQVDDNKIASNSISKILKQYFGSRLFQEPLRPMTPIYKLLGKVVPISGFGIGSEKLREVICGVWYSSEYKNKPCTASFPLNKNRIVRIYPSGAVTAGVIMSYNYNPRPFVKKRANFIALNVQTNDKHLRKYRKIFKTSSFIKLESQN